MKIKKIALIEIITLIIALSTAGIYFAPKFLKDKEMQTAAKIKSNNAVFTAKVLEEFAKDKNQKASEISKKVAQELNKTTKNPYNQKQDAYIFEENHPATSSVTFDDAAQMVIITSYNKNSELIARTVIKPPSFVVYSKFDDKD